MSIFVLGINHKTAPVELREQLTFQPGELPAVLAGLQALEGVHEVVVVATCNRTEVWCALRDEADAGAVRGWMESRAAVHGALYQHHGSEAVRHLFRVACGLDSMILGEPQILGQLKQAYRDAHDAGTIGASLSRAFQQAFSVAKRVRTDTGIGAAPVSVAYAAVGLAKQIFANFNSHCALLVGAGDTIELTARHLRANGIGRLLVANRSLARAQSIAERFQGFATRLDALDTHLAEADIIITATASPHAILTRAQFERAAAGRRHRPVFIVDLAVPRDVEPAVGELEDVFLYSVDDLRGVVEEGLRARSEAADEAERIIDLGVAEFEGVLRTLGAVGTIRSLRDRAGEIRDETLAEATRMLARGDAADEVVLWLSHTLTSRLMHEPTVRLRDAGYQGDDDALAAARRLLGLGEESS